MAAICKVIKKLDFIGPEFNFEKDNSIRYRTIQGAIFSVLTFIAALIIAFMFGQEVYQRKNPNVSSSNEFLEFSKIYMKDFPLLFSFHYADTKEIKNIENTLDFEVGIFSVDINSNISVFNNYTLTPCKNQVEKFQTNKNTIKGLLASNSFNFYCVNFDDSMAFQNSMATPNSTYVRIMFNLCSNKTRASCIPNPIIDSRLMIVVMTFINSYVDAVNFSNPVIPYIDRFVQPLSKNFNKVMNMMISTNIFISDDGWMLEDFRKISYFSFSNYKLDINPRENALNNIFAVILESPRLRNKNNRNYLKVQELFARVGGIANAFFLIIYIVSCNYLRFKYLLFVREHSFKMMDNEYISNMKMSKSILLSKNVSGNPISSEMKYNISSNNCLDNNGKGSNLDNENRLVANDLNRKSTQKLNLVKNAPEKINKGVKVNHIDQNNSNNKFVPQGDVIYPSKLDNIGKVSQSKRNSEANNQSTPIVKELKREIGEILFGDSEKEFEDEEDISYKSYLGSLLFWWCMKKENLQKYKFEFTRIKRILDITTFQHFLTESYAIQYKN